MLGKFKTKVKEQAFTIMGVCKVFAPILSESQISRISQKTRIRPRHLIVLLREHLSAHDVVRITDYADYADFAEKTPA